ncbi:uncharacterized protein LOC135161472 [Diachasmimorpha longicaudata]|uniref:uncharacterized protein LOC135161472 n=1 Tax=Diachasmimorpha longicaudata TaxID=58733 RepID=UPI0030B8A113
MELNNIKSQRIRELARLRMSERRKVQKDHASANQRRLDKELIDDLLSDEESNESNGLFADNVELDSSNITSKRIAGIHSDEGISHRKSRSVSETSDNFEIENEDRSDCENLAENFYDCEERDDMLERSIGSENDIWEASVAEEDFSDFDDEIEAPEIDELREWSLQVPPLPHTRVDGLLKILRKRLLPTLPDCSKVFLDTTNAEYKIQKYVDSEFVYFGVAKTLIKTVNPYFHGTNILHLTNPRQSPASFSRPIKDLDDDGLEDEKKDLKEIMIMCCRQVRMIGHKIDRLKGQFVEMKNEITHLRSAPHPSQLIDGFGTESEGDEARDGFKLPCQTLEELRAFDKQLEEDKSYRKKICMKVHKCINKELSLSRNLGVVLRKFLTQQVGNKMTPLKKVQGKELFKNLKFYGCLIAVFGLNFGSKKEPLERKTFNVALSGALNNSGDWDGGRSRRAKRTKLKEPINPEYGDAFMAEILAENEIVTNSRRDERNGD